MQEMRSSNLLLDVPYLFVWLEHTIEVQNPTPFEQLILQVHIRR